MSLEAVFAWLFVIGGTLFFLSVLWPSFVGAPWLPSRRKDVRAMLAMAEVGPDDVVYDLGSGDGRVLIAAAQEYGARAVGIEIDPARLWLSRLLVRIKGLQARVTVLHANFFATDLSGADVVVVYLRQDTNNRLVRKLSRELEPGARVVASTFILPGWEVAAMDREAQLYLYRMREREPTEAPRTETATA